MSNIKRIVSVLLTLALIGGNLFLGTYAKDEFPISKSISQEITNIALDATPIGDSNDTSNNSWNSKVNDGDLATYWMSNSAMTEDDPCWIMLDFRVKAIFNKVVIYWEYSRPTPDGYVIQYSDNDEIWTDINVTASERVDADDSKFVDTVTFDNVTAQYVRIYCTKAEKVNGGDDLKEKATIWELEVYGTLTAEAPPKPDDPSINNGNNNNNNNNDDNNYDTTVMPAIPSIDNFALSAETIADSYDLYCGPENVTDGDMTSFWSSEASMTENDPCWIKLELKEVRNLSRIDIHWALERPSKDGYTLEISQDGNNWTKLSTDSITRVKIGSRHYCDVITFAPVSVKYLVVRCTNGENYNSVPQQNARIYEIEAYGDVFTNSYYTYYLSNEGAVIFNVDTSISGDVVIPSVLDGHSVTGIESYTFEDYNKLTSITIPDSVTFIGTGAFSDCDYLKTAVIGDGISTLNSGIFSRCKNLKTVTLGKNFSQIKPTAFEDCQRLENIYVSDENPYILSDDGIVFSKDKTELIIYPIGKTQAEYVVPDSVTSIKDRAFECCEYLTSIVIGDNVSKIGYMAFASCFNLSEISLGNNITSIGPSAFVNTAYYNFYDDALVYIGEYLVDVAYKNTAPSYCVIKDGTRLIADEVFMMCTSIETIVIPDGVEIVGNNAFMDTTSLKNIFMSNSVTSMKIDPFFDCIYLDHIYYNGSEEEWSELAIETYKATVHFNATQEDYKKITVNPTCLDDGYTADYCNICHKEYNKKIVENISNDNLAIHGTAFDDGSDNYYDDYAYPYNLNDGDLTTCWQYATAGEQGTAPEWPDGIYVGIKFEEPQTVNKVKINLEDITRYEASREGMILQYTTDNQTWCEVPNAKYRYAVDKEYASDVNVYDVITFDSIEVLGIRAVMYKGTDKYCPRIFEMEIYNAGHNYVDEVCEKCGKYLFDGITFDDEALTASGDYSSLTAKDVDEVKDKNGNALSDNALIGTGCIITKDGKNYTVIMGGDTSGDGKINSTDFMQVRKQYLGFFSMNNGQTLAADVNHDGKINSTDFIQIRKHFLGLYNLYE